jgi:hypothetical protein
MLNRQIIIWARAIVAREDDYSCLAIEAAACRYYQIPRSWADRDDRVLLAVAQYQGHLLAADLDTGGGCWTRQYGNLVMDDSIRTSCDYDQGARVGFLTGLLFLYKE